MQPGIIILLFADELAVFNINGYGRIRVKVAGENLSRDESLKAALQISAKRSCAVNGIESAVDDELLGGVGNLESEALVRKTLLEGVEHDIDDALEVVFCQRTEEYRLVKTVEELGTEAAAQLVHNALARLLGDVAVLVDAVEQILATEVRCKDNYRVLEVHGASLTVGYTAVIEHLKQDVEYIRMRLFNLIEQHDRIGLAAYRLGQLTALIVSDISGRRSDKTGDGVFLHVFGHIDTNHVVFVIKQAVCKSLCKLRLADTGGA